MLSTDFRLVANMAFIDLPSATQDGYKTAGGVYVAPKPHERLEDAAAVIGTVVATGPNLHFDKFVGETASHQPIYEKVPIDIQPGDKIAVDYRVVAAGEWKGDQFEHSGAWLINGKIVWKAEADTLIAVQRGGKWAALGDHILLKPYVKEKYTSSLIYIPETAATETQEGVALHVSGLENVGEGTKVFYHSQFATPYRFESGEEMLVIRKDYVFGTYED